MCWEARSICHVLPLKSHFFSICVCFHAAPFVFSYEIQPDFCLLFYYLSVLGFVFDWCDGLEGKKVGFVALGFNFFWPSVLSFALIFFLLQQTFSDAPWVKKWLVFHWYSCDGYISLPMGLLNSGTFRRFLGFCWRWVFVFQGLSVLFGFLSLVGFEFGKFIF